MKRVLLISYYYPPMPAVGGLRARGLVKYLPEFGWEAVVLHGSLEGKGTLVHRLFGINPNQNLLAQAQELQRKVKVPIEWALRLYAEWFKYPDATGRWKEEVPEHFIERVLDSPIPELRAIISTSSPVSCHLAAKSLKERLGLSAPPPPWIADFRDLWTQNHYYPYSRFRLRRERKLELETLRTADVLVTTSEPPSEDMGRLHGREVHTILNGYDPDELNDGSTPLTSHPTLTYTGNIYRGKQSLEGEEGELLKALGDGGEIRFYGSKQGWLDKRIKQYGIVSREEALQRQRESHYLLLLKWGGQLGAYTQKLFEYMAARRPIWSVGQIDPYVDKIVTDANRDDIEKYSQRETARKFATLLDGIAG